MAKATATPELTTESIVIKVTPSLDKIWEAVSKENPNSEKIAALDSSLKQFEADPAFASIFASMQATATELQDQGLATAREKFALALVHWANDKKVPLALKSGRDGWVVGKGKTAGGGKGSRMRLSAEQKETKQGELSAFLKGGKRAMSEILDQLKVSRPLAVEFLKNVKAKREGEVKNTRYHL